MTISIGVLTISAVQKDCKFKYIIGSVKKPDLGFVGLKLYAAV